MFDDFKNVVFKPDFKKMMEGYMQSAMLSGAYSAYNPFVMHFAGLMGAMHSLFELK